MQINIKSQLRRLSNRINLLSVIQEAVVNSIQARATNIQLIFHRYIKQGELLEDAVPDIIGLDIIDNGEGFTEENRVYFSEYGSELKKMKAAKIFSWFAQDYIAVASDNPFILVDMRYVKKEPKLISYWGLTLLNRKGQIEVLRLDQVPLESKN